MSRLLPPLAALRVFEAAARHASFTRAAGELGMTQAAVSYQVKVLEERVGAPLFLRGHRGVALSREGTVLAAAATEALDRLASAYASARGTSAGVLRISVIPTFAAAWLARHLGEFQLAHPDLAVQLESSPSMVDFARSDIDLCIRCTGGESASPELADHPLLDAAFSPMLSPALAARHEPLGTPADLLQLPLIDPTDPWWGLWFAAAGVERPGFEIDDGPRMGAQHLEAVAAMAGHGVAVLTPFFFREELASGRLVQPFATLCQGDRIYRLTYPAARRNAPKIRVFREWLLSHFPEPSPSRE